ncbi:valine--tRNA ligase [Frigidibacter sp. ROC022]|uniref:valine--tRNA ligase n=1 Tax=Frigidibacter sp. ROC022 TaxID=2971796 RepID=UPI00215AC27A|nr:valine--tRNA ligase [Frigidibacter sp. ROC022]MCR8722964.1 valine--tRNA ligase [Frigidibacter sp. ROC022]
MPMEKTFDATEAEARIAAMWEASGAFRAGANASRKETFCIMIPPPNVTGALHVGHAFNNTLQDILTRWHRMRGFDTLWQPGTDHAGIATQLQVEKRLMAESDQRRTDLSREEFIAKVWEYKQEFGSTIINQLKRLGASCDWDRIAFTMSGAPGAPEGEEGNFHDAVLKVFVDLYQKGLITRGKRLVNWDPHFETAISDLEVENIEIDGHMWHFKYPLQGGETYEYIEKDEDGNVILRETRDYISIATTRPETMLGDGAVAVHPSDERYAPIVGKLCEIPVGPKEHRRLIPIITDTYPDKDFGSGAVKITGAHDFNDYAVATRNGIPLYRLMDTKGAMRDDGDDYATVAARAQEIAEGASFDAAEIDTLNLVPEAYRGLDRFEARKRVIADIDAEGLMLKVESKKIMQPFGDRSKVVIEPMLTDQWFVDAKTLAGPALEAVNDGRIQILPERDKKVYDHWLENIEPWCISRQLWWGHRVPVWYGLDLGVDTGDLNASGDLDDVQVLGLLVRDGMLQGGDVMHCATDFESVKDAFRAEIIDVPNPLSNAAIVEVADKQEAMDLLAERLAEYAINQDPTHLVYPVWRDPDVLDTWFSSGLWPIGTLGWPEDTPEFRKYFPTSVLVTGFDILFFWVARMIMMQMEVVKEVPFHTVYLHALVRDEKGVKMSKTLGNVIDPLELIDEVGADAVRFTMASMAALGGTLKLSKERVTGYRNFTTKLWNAARFAEMNGVFQAPRNGIPSPKETLNKWIIGETARIRETVDQALEGYRFNEAALGLYAFVWGKVCDWYVEFSKPLLLDGTEAQKAETQETMAWVLDQCAILLHPFMPFITEELWGLMAPSRAKPCVHADWPEYGAELIDAEADREMNWVISLIENIRSARAEMHVPAGLHLAMLKLSLDAAGEAAWARNEVLIKRLARIDSLEAAEAAPKGSITVAVDGGTFALPLAGIIDVAAENDRLSKALAKLEKDLAGLNGRLKNPKFVESAPEDVVEETRELQTQKSEEAGRLKAALARLAELG